MSSSRATETEAEAVVLTKSARGVVDSSVMNNRAGGELSAQQQLLLLAAVAGQGEGDSIIGHYQFLLSPVDLSCPLLVSAGCSFAT